MTDAMVRTLGQRSAEFREFWDDHHVEAAVE